MSTNAPPLSEFRAVWLFTLFDLPVRTRKQRRAYAQFRKELIARGFMMLQYSVYARYCRSIEASDVHRTHIKAILPPEGQVRLLFVTDHQFGKMDVFHGKTPAQAEPPPKQLLLF